MSKKRDLSGTWKASITSRDEGFDFPIPGDSITAMKAAGMADDPYIGTKELDIQWINRETITIERSFALSGESLGYDHMDLVLPQVDTAADIYINGSLVGKTTSGFIGYRFPVRDLLKPDNSMKIILHPAELLAEQRNGELPYRVPHQVYPVQSMHRNLVRKVQCHSGWDWGPCLMVSGLYEAPFIECWDDTRIESLRVDTLQGTDGPWDLDIHVELEITDDLSLPETPVEISLPELGITYTFSPSEVKTLRDIRRDGERAYITHTCRFSINDPKLWWPAGYGDQPLYTLEVRTGEDRKELSFGFRTVNIDFRDDEYGRAMTVMVNGRRIFCKGANWIPVDGLPSLQSDARYRQLLSDSVEVGMNMLRVWGGGQYEKDVFYEICDEKGLLIWHDCMFSCSLYPSTDWFLDEVRTEMHYQIKRLQHHPSIALWCGNNEDVGALTWYPESIGNRDRYIIDYDRLNEGVIGNTVRELDPHRPWWPSSPSGGPGDYSDCWHDDTTGDMHYWSVWHEGKPFEAYREVIPRFCSEFGFQSFSSASEMDRVIDEDQLYVTSEQMLHHQKNPRGNHIITETMKRYFTLPSDPPQVLYLSQVQQAYGIQTAVDYWRSHRERCMGILYWQLNDLWPVASWASIEYSGRWKMLHHNAGAFFSEIRTTAVPEGDEIRFYGINDTDGQRDLEFILFKRDSRTGEILKESTSTVSLSAEGSTLLGSISWNRECSTSVYELVLFDGEEVLSRNWHFPLLPNQTQIEEPTITVTRDEERDIWRIETDKPAYYLWLSCACPGHFSDNGFHLMPGEPVEVFFNPSEGTPYGADAPSGAEDIICYDLYHAMRG